MFIKNEKAAAACTLGLLLSVAVYASYVHESALGRDAYLNAAAARFDKYIASPHWTIPMLIAYLSTVALFLFAYEGLTRLFEKLAAMRKER